MTEAKEIKQWMEWYLEKPINVREVYGDALEFTEEERRLTALIKVRESK